jgi:hypothetical protein
MPKRQVWPGRWRRIPGDLSGRVVVHASGYIDPDFKSKMQRAGVQGFIEKPYNPDDVVRMLRDLFATD